ncbi:MAG: zinc ABC transporter substrate-binding protein [Verrucomicrobia bacterium]|nr:zinc ABC transporter substrate-binding protein [Verrucomicrobiota bacterium]
MKLPALFALLLVVPTLRAAEPLRIASLHTVTTEIATRVGGEKVKVTGLVKAGTDPHDFEPTPDDLKIVAASDLIIAAGKGLEGYLDKLQQSSGTKAPLLKAGDTLPNYKAIVGPGHEGHDHGADPHWWHSIGAVEKVVGVVRERLAKLRPSDKAAFEQNATAYLAELAELKKWAAAEIAKIPRDQRKLVTTHDAFQFFAKDYGFRIYPIRGISTDDEPSSKKVAELIAVIKKQKVRAIFPEAVENPKVMAEITRETGAKVAGQLLADGLGEGEAATYVGMFKKNVGVIVAALAQ